MGKRREEELQRERKRRKCDFTRVGLLKFGILMFFFFPCDLSRFQDGGLVLMPRGQKILIIIVVDIILCAV